MLLSEVLPVSLSFPLLFRRTHPPAVFCCFCVFVEVGVSNTISGWLQVNLSLSGKQGGRAIWEVFLLSAVLEIWRFCMVIRSLLPISLETMHDPKEPVL